MSKFSVVVAGAIKLPSGATVGDEFRIAGKVRITAIAEDMVDIRGMESGAEMLPGSRSYQLYLSEVDVDARMGA